MKILTWLYIPVLEEGIPYEDEDSTDDDSDLDDEDMEAKTRTKGYNAANESFSEYQLYYLNLLFPNELLFNIISFSKVLRIFFITGYFVLLGSQWIFTRFIRERIQKGRVTKITIVCL